MAIPFPLRILCKRNSMARDIQESRAEIDALNRTLVEAFCRRMEVSADVAAYKRERGLPVYDRTREREILADMAELAGEDYRYYAKVFFTVLMDLSKARQSALMAEAHAKTHPEDVSVLIERAMERTPQVFPDSGVVACQGVEGAYSQLAADRLFALPRIRYCGTFGDVFEAVEKGSCDFGVLPIENSTYGTVNEVYDLMQRYRFCIVRSIKLRIDHRLLAKPGTRLENIRAVYSHGQAIGQCRRFLDAHPEIETHICRNTAEAASTVARMERDDVAAIASESCAMLYGLEQMADGATIMNAGRNDTRFICIAKDPAIYPGATKISLMLTLPHEPGSLYTTLAKFTAQGVNLTKLESRPIEGRDFDMRFYFDFEASPAEPRIRTLLNDLERSCETFTFLGGYSEI